MEIMIKLFYINWSSRLKVTETRSCQIIQKKNELSEYHVVHRITGDSGELGV